MHDKCFLSRSLVRGLHREELQQKAFEAEEKRQQEVRDQLKRIHALSRERAKLAARRPHTAQS